MTAIRRTGDFDIDEDSLIEHLMFGDHCVKCLIRPPLCEGIPYATLQLAWQRYKGKVLQAWQDRGFDRAYGINPWAWREFEGLE